MKGPRRIFRALLAAVAVAVSAGTFARRGSATEPAVPTEAADRFAEGERLFAAGQFEAAARAFERAYALVPHPDATWNAAQAWLKVDEPRAANLLLRYL